MREMCGCVSVIGAWWCTNMYVVVYKGVSEHVNTAQGRCRKESSKIQRTHSPHLSTATTTLPAPTRPMFSLFTLDTSHLEMLVLNDAAPMKMELMSVTLDTSHPSGDSCGPSEQSPSGDNFKLIPNVNAMLLECSCGLWGCGGGGCLFL